MKLALLVSLAVIGLQACASRPEAERSILDEVAASIEREDAARPRPEDEFYDSCSASEALGLCSGPDMHRDCHCQDETSGPGRQRAVLEQKRSR